MHRNICTLIVGLTLTILSALANAQGPPGPPPGPPPGRPPLPEVDTKMVDVNGLATRYHAANLDKRAEGAPVVIFINGGGGPPLELWGKVFDGLGSDIPRFAYDRPGAGKTAPIEGKLTPERANAHLAALLKELKIGPPYVLVGWSWGGPLALDFASRNPGTVVGNVILDPTVLGRGPEDERERLLRLGAKKEDIDAAEAKSKKGQEEGFARMPPGIRSELEAISESIETGFDPPYPRVPTTILLAAKLMPGFTRGELPPGVDESAYYREERASARQFLEARLKDAPASVVRMLPESGHTVSMDAPEAVVEEIKRVLGVVNKK